jgi:receptor protein-tyrosine kinase
MIGIALALLLERLDRRLRGVDEIAEQFGLPVLSVVPDSNSHSIAPSAPLRGPMAEAFQMLRTNLRYVNFEQEIRSIVVTSSVPGEGKSTVAWHLARASAASGARTLLIEADLRHPVLGEHVGASLSGLTDVLARTVPFESAIVQVSSGDLDESDSGLHLLTAGRIPPNPGALLDSTWMRSLLRSVEERYDLVVVDTPPVSIVADALPLCTQVSGVIVVARPLRTTRDGAKRLREQLTGIAAITLGVVVNAYSRKGGGYDPYAYGYDTTSAVDTPAGGNGAAGQRPSVGEVAATTDARGAPTRRSRRRA